MYIPKDTVLHRLNAKSKLAMTATASVSAVMFYNPLPALFIFLACLPVAAIGRVLGSFLKRYTFIVTMIIVIVVFQSFFYAFEHHVISTVHLGPLTLELRYEGVWKALWLITIISAFVGWLSLLFITTHPGDLFAALQEVKLPYLVGFILLAALQMVPMMQRALTLCIEAQRSRGLEIGRNPLKLVPIVIPLTVGALERINKMSWSLEGRAFGSAGKKTSLRSTELRRADWFLIVASAIFLGVMIYLRAIWGSLYIPYDVFFPR
jgi:energy-coupling factor transporter transmembrane protein EcfT